MLRSDPGDGLNKREFLARAVTHARDGNEPTLTEHAPDRNGPVLEPWRGVELPVCRKRVRIGVVDLDLVGGALRQRDRRCEASVCELEGELLRLPDRLE